MRLLLPAAALLVSASLLLPGPARSDMIVDAEGRSVEVTDRSRIVSIGGAVTEILFALGMEDSVIAVDTTSTYPAAAEEKPDVGYMRALAAEGVLSLNPTLVLAVEGSGPREVIEVLQSASVPFVAIPDDPTPEGVAEKIRAVAAAAGVPAEGEKLASEVLEDTKTIAAAVADAPKVPTAFVLAMSGGAPMVAGAETSADGMLRLAGATNVFDAFTGFKPATPEGTVAAAPEAIVAMSTGGRHTGNAVKENPAFMATPAAIEGRIFSFDGGYLLGFGPRTAEALRDLAAALHPGIQLPELPERSREASASAGGSRAR